MIPASVILLAILFASIWLFVRKQPNTDRVVALRRYNISVALIAVVAVCLVTLYFWATRGKSEAMPWWLGSAVLGSMLLVVVFIIATFLRFVVFRHSRGKKMEDVGSNAT
jgi:cytochrome bd-type quinol oxidase subunit 2